MNRLDSVTHNKLNYLKKTPLLMIIIIVSK